MPPKLVLLITLSAALTLSMPAQNSSMHTSHKPFGVTSDGTKVELITLTSPHVEVSISTYGGRVVSLKVPDKSGKPGDVILGFDDLHGYLGENPYFGALIGRYANRIAHGKFTLDGQTYQLAKNDGDNTLHGGKIGFDRRIWTPKTYTDHNGANLELTYLSKDGEENFPGNLTAKVVYTLTPAGDIRIDYSATTDKDTVINLSNHTYFNLAGHGDILNHRLTLYASHFTPVDSGLIPTGEIKSVKGTPFDFLTPHAIGERIGQDDEQLKLGKGYDHNWVNDSTSGQLAKSAEVYEPTTGRVLEVWTTQPGTQFYTGNFLDGTITGKGGWKYVKRSALCLETQHFPDSPNHPKFPTAELKPGQTFHQVTVWKFSTR